jgi:DNA-binding response OmpR family regulator
MSKDLILVVDDVADIRYFVKAALAPEGYDLIEASNGTDALHLIRTRNPSLVILDLSIGQPDGFEVCREVRKTSTVPIIILTSHVQEMDEAMCLAAGADDYITKPVSARILALRTSTQIRHRAAVKSMQGSVITFEDLALDTESRDFFIEGRRIELTKTEYDFLGLLFTNPKRVFSREEVSQAIGTSHEYSSDHLLDTHASRIRMKIKEVSEKKVLHAVRGVGYRLLSN